MQAWGSVDTLPAPGPTHGTPPPPHRGNFLPPQPGPDRRDKWVMTHPCSPPQAILTTGLLLLATVSLAVRLQGNWFYFMPRAWGIKRGAGWRRPWPLSSGQIPSIFFSCTFIYLLHMLSCAFFFFNFIKFQNLCLCMAALGLGCCTGFL